MARPRSERPLHGEGGALGQVHVARDQALLKPPEGREAYPIEFLRAAELQGQVFDPLAYEVMGG